MKNSVRKLSSISVPGFALVSTVAVMALVVMIALAMVGMATVTSRSAGHTHFIEQARANARMALSMALAQLQATTGVDQSVTAPASIFDSSPETVVIDGVQHPHIIGAWSTLKSDGSSIIYQHDDGYHMDSRNSADSGFEDHREQMVWLVSGGDTFDPRSDSLAEGVDAVSFGDSEGDAILAPLVDVASGSGNGMMAYHIQDMGAALPVVQFNPHVDLLPEAANAAAGGYSNLYNGRMRRVDLLTETSAAFSDFADPSHVKESTNSSKYVTQNTLELTHGGGLNTDAKTLIGSYSQSYVHSNSALFTDTMSGGLCVDLSQYTQDGSVTGGGVLYDDNDDEILNDYTPLLEHTRFAAMSPKFGALRDYVTLANFVGADGSVAPRAPIFGGGDEGDYPDPTKVIQHGVHPVIAEYSIYLSVAPDASSPTGLSLQFYPRFTLWNPYNVKLETSGYFVQVNHKVDYGVMVNDKRGTHNEAYDYYGTNSLYFSGGALSGDGSGATARSFFFYVKPTSFEAGQCLVFTAENGTMNELKFRDSASLSTNILTADADVTAGSRGGFYMHLNQKRANKPANASTDVPKFDPALSPSEFKFGPRGTVWGLWGGSYNSFYIGAGAEGQSARLRIAPSSASYATLESAGTTESPSYPIVHTLDWNERHVGAGGQSWDLSNDAWQPMSSMTPMNNVPYDRTKLGARLKSFTETAEMVVAHPNLFWNYPLLELSNMRSPIFRRTPWDWPITSVTKAGAGAWGSNPTVSFGPVVTEEIRQPGYVENFMLPQINIDGVQESSPFMNSQSYAGDLRFPVFDVPVSGVNIFSPAQYRSATLTHEFSAPSFISGESIVSVTTPRHQSAYSKADYKTNWEKGLDPNKVGVMKWWQSAYDPSQSYAAYDYRYETNLALWDKYMFSTLPNGVSLEDYQNNLVLANSRIEVVSSENLADIKESSANRVAEHLRLRNHLSVNSTNRSAWKALLSMNRGLDVAGKDTAADSVPFTGAMSPFGDGTTPVSSESTEAWNGYRQLSDSEMDSLVDELVAEVKRRAPFISKSDFVNRRLYTLDSVAADGSPLVSGQSDQDLLSYAGALDVAIARSGVNANLLDYAIGSASGLSAPAGGAPRPDSANMPQQRYSGLAAHLSQGKVLETIGASLTARSDTFRVRAYGCAKNSQGAVVAEVYCEAVVQRGSAFVDAVDEAHVAIGSLTSDTNKAYGRRYAVVQFKWLNASELN